MKVRRALALAINRDQIAKVLLGPLGVEAKPLQNHLFMGNQKGYKDNAGALSSPNAEEAKKLLDEAGWKVEGEFRKKDGKVLEIRFVIPSQVASSQQESSLIFNMLKAINVNVKIDSVPSDDFFDKYINTGQLRLHRLLVDRHAVPDQLVEVDLRPAQGRRHPAELRPGRVG